MIDPNLVGIIALASFGSIAGLLGDLIFLIKKSYATVLSRYSIPLAAGVLLTVSFVELLPEALESGSENVFIIILFTYVLLFLLERFFFHLHHYNPKLKINGPVAFVLFGDTLHNFLDGVAIASSFLVNPSLGIVVTISTFLHEIPHEIVDFGILLSAKWKPIKALYANLLSALATFVGVLTVYFLSFNFENVNSILLSISVGLFMYVSTTDFLPEIGKEVKKPVFLYYLFFILGIAIVFLGHLLLPEA